MIARNIVGALIAAALLSGCGGGGHSASATPPNAAAKSRKPDATVSLTLHFPSNAIRALPRPANASTRSRKGARSASAGTRTPLFLDSGGFYPNNQPLIVISGGDILNSPQSGTTVCAIAAPGPDGTQTVPGIPIYSDGGYVSVQEYQSGDTGTCQPGVDGNGNPVPLLAETASTTYDIPTGPNSYYSETAGGPQYTGGFAPGTDVVFSTLFPTGITLDGVAKEYIYSTDGYDWYVADGSDDFQNALCPDDFDDIYLAAADANGIGVASAVTSVTPSSSLTGGFPSVLITNVIPNGPTFSSGPRPGSIAVDEYQAQGPITFTFSLTDYLNNPLPTYTETATVNSGCG